MFFYHNLLKMQRFTPDLALRIRVSINMLELNMAIFPWCSTNQLPQLAGWLVESDLKTDNIISMQLKKSREYPALRFCTCVSAKSIPSYPCSLFSHLNKSFYTAYYLAYIAHCYVHQYCGDCMDAMYSHSNKYTNFLAPILHCGPLWTLPIKLIPKEQKKTLLNMSKRIKCRYTIYSVSFNQMSILYTKLFDLK